MAETLHEKIRRVLADTYDIDREIGEGGMAFVFIARDLKHDREVAVKVLKPELASSLGAERFLREIRTTAKLSHPHILPLYDSGEAEDLLYYVMPFVVGESLDAYLSREQQLSIEESIRITREVGEALSHAHSHGLVHRDIKPDNVMLSGGHAVVADFGIARAVTEAGGEKLTQTGMAVGTPAYMSPEQAAGDPNVDARSDIYSLGCMLYEMLVGQIPFTGPTPMAIIARHTMDHVTPPSIMRQSVPEELEDVVLRAMEKTPADRFRTAQEFVEALQAIERGEAPAGMRGPSGRVRLSRASRLSTSLEQPVAAPPRRWPVVAGAGGGVALAAAVGAWLLLGENGGAPRPVDTGLDPRDVAVLYFDDLSADSSLRFAADGLTEELIDQLARVQGLQVISRNGVAPYREERVPYDSIGRALTVGTIVTGSVERAGGDIRVSTRLIDGGSGSDLGARDAFQLPAADLLAARDSVVGIVARFLRQRIGAEVRVRELRAGTGSVEAWSLLQRGVRLRRDLDQAASRADTVDRLEEADSLLRLASQADPIWPEPVLERGWVAYHRAGLETGRATVPWLELAAALADSVLDVDPNEARALELRGTTRFRHYTLNVTDDPTAWRRLLSSAQEDLEAATDLDDGLASAYLTLSRLYYWVDDVGSALIAAQRAYQADAYLEQLDDTIDRVFWGQIDQEQFGPAETWCNRGAARFPDDVRFVRCQLWLMVTPGITADVARAWEVRARLDSLGASPLTRAQGSILVGGILARAGLVDSARSVWNRTRQHIDANGIDPHLELAHVEAYARSLAGDFDEAIDLLKRAVAANPDHDFAEAASRSWWWREIRQHPRWREVAGGS